MQKELYAEIYKDRSFNNSVNASSLARKQSLPEEMGLFKKSTMDFEDDIYIQEQKK